MLLAGLGSLRPNTLLLDWFSNMVGMSPAEYIRVIKNVQMTDMHVLLARNFDSMDLDAISRHRNYGVCVCVCVSVCVCVCVSVCLYLNFCFLFFVFFFFTRNPDDG